MSELLFIFGLGDQASTVPGLWFRLKEEPRPCPTLDAMLQEIDRARHATDGLALPELKGLLGEKVDARQGRVVLALGYPDAGGAEQWLFVEIDVAGHAGGARWVRWSTRGTLEHLPVRAFATASMTPSALMRRTGHVAKDLENRAVAIFGVGAVGSVVALLLAKTGIPRLRLVDNDQMRPGNAVRHAAGLGFVGRDKTAAVRAEIRDHAPYCKVLSEVATWNPGTIEEWVREADIVVDATGNEVFSLLLNDVCVRQETPIVFVGTYRRAAIGRVRVVRPGKDACLVCHLFGYQRDERKYPQAENEYLSVPAGDEGAFIEEGCGVPTVEATAPDVEASANWAARAVLWLLRDQLGDRNHCLIVNDVLPDAPAALSEVGVHWTFWPPIPTCDCCGKGGNGR